MGQTRFRLQVAVMLFTALLFFAVPSPSWSAPVRTDLPTMQFFWAENCPHCLQAKTFIKKLQQQYPQLKVDSYEIWNNRKNFQKLIEISERFGNATVSTPTIVFGDNIWYGFSPDTGKQIEAAIAQHLTATKPPAVVGQTIPFLGQIDDQQHSLTALALVLGGLDSFNPCAFFVLLFLLSLLIHAHSRRRMLLVGITFVCFSGIIYFLFMAAWLNLFLLAGNLHLLTAAAGGLAVLISLVNIKDFFFFKQGVTLSIPEQAKPKLFARMRRLVGADRIATVLLGTVILAVAANSYELLCTAGFPMVFTRLLTLQHLPVWQHYAYLTLYNLVYVLPLLVITITFSWTLGSHKLTEREGRLLKLVSGLMMLQLGLALLIKPDLLHSLTASLAMLAVALLIGGAIALVSHLQSGSRKTPYQNH